ncbi:MAG: hypothetical protein IJ783_00145 [Kiritimatiellae bacterium]|nr:hypothetical protein [Kiritimatiellia bacterium]
MMKTQFLAIAAALAAGCSQTTIDVATTPQPALPDSAPEVAPTPAPSQFAPEGENVTEAHPLSVSVTQKGGLSFPGGDIDVVAYSPGWAGIPVKVDWQSAEGGEHVFEIRGNDGPVLFRGRGSWAEAAGGALEGVIEIECLAETPMQCLAVAASVPEEPPFGLGDGSSASYDLPAQDGRRLRVEFPKPVAYHSQDSRQWGGRWSVRFGGALGARTFQPGDRLAWNMKVSSPDGIAMTSSKPVTIARGDDWVPLEYRKDPIPGSALDFSGMGFQDAPAGKYGWLRAVGGRFEFEGLPGVEQRFYGVNLCFSANYPDHEMADRIVDRFAMCGYNSIRVHHHDGMWAKDDDGARDKLDYLLARCFERGIYVTTDLYVSRIVAWREIGVDRDGNMEKQLYKTYIGLHGGAFSNWCDNARAFLEHVNPYTGRAMKDEPGIPLISLVNEGKLHMAWARAGKAKDPVVRAAWKRFCEERGVPPEKFDPEPAGPGSNDYADPHHQFDEWVNRRVWERGSAFVRSLGCRALLTNDNNGRWHGEGEGLTPLYDYVDSHFYVDHPAFLEQQWKLPSRCSNANPIRAELPAILHRGYAKGSAKPYAITEWNFSGPGSYRAMGGILTGALAAEQEWDGLWRFAYSHNRDNFADGIGGPGFFDCVTDPLIAASDRASVCLFLGARNAQAPDSGRPALVLDKDNGTMVLDTPQVCGGFAEQGTIDAGPLSFTIRTRGGTAAPSEAKTAGKDREEEAVGGDVFASGGGAARRHDPAARRHCPATLWVTALDGKPVPASSRMLLVHLTDVQGEGARYADNTRRVLLKWGKTPLVEAGAAAVALHLDAGAPAPAVAALDTAGARVATVPSEWDPATGTLRFEVSTRGPDGAGRICYEIYR